MSVEVRTIVSWMEEWAPPAFAEPDDKIGLQVGSMHGKVTRVAVALDVTEAVIEEAIERGAELIIAHHPIIFRPLQAIRTDRADGRLLAKLLRHGISVYAAHTNLDVAVGGVNDMLADALGLGCTKPLKVTNEDPLYKLVVYVPLTHVEALETGVFAAGAGHIGHYSHCGFTFEGTGSFLPEDGTRPYVGEAGRLERVGEKRFETVMPASKKAAVLNAVLTVHPYEEVAYDLYRLEQPGPAYGLGRVGELPASMTLGAFAELAKRAFGVPTLRIVGDESKPVQKIAVLGGSGRSFVKHALAVGADAFVTGDLDHHTAHDALAAGLALIDPGHHIESIMKRGVASLLNTRSVAEGWDIDAYASNPSTEPFTFK